MPEPAAPAIPLAAPRLLFGLDLGQSQDFSALAVAEQVGEQAPGSQRVRRCYRVRHLHRWPLGTAYTAPNGKPRGIVEDVAALLEKTAVPATLIVDGTGCGRPVIDIFRAAALRVASLVPVVITGGHSATLSGGYWHAPKADLAGAVAACLESRRLQIAPSLEKAPLLRRELTTFRVKVTAAGNETFEAWRERDHDDLVLAVALATWYGERATPAGIVFLDGTAAREERQVRRGPYVEDIDPGPPVVLPPSCPRCHSDLVGDYCGFCECTVLPADPGRAKGVELCDSTRIQ